MSLISNRQLFLQHLGQTTFFPLMLEVERAEGVYLYGPNNQKWIDLISGIGVSSLGHCHPKVVEAVIGQAQKYMHLMVYGELVQSPQVLLAQALVDTLPKKIQQVYLVNSGSEAIEGAMKLARRHTRRPNLIACHNAYHGSTIGALSLCGNEIFKQAYRPLLPGISHISHGNIEDLKKIDHQTAAVFIEIIQAEAGVQDAPDDYWQALAAQCKKMGTLLVIDEIQTGFGRTGTFWGFEQHGLEPDIVVSAKAMGAGMPIGAFMSSSEVMQSLAKKPILGHITTFGGHPVSAAAALAGLQVIKQENLAGQAIAKGELIKKLCQSLPIKQLRGKGLLLAADFENFDRLKKIIDKAIELGVLTDWFLYCDHAMRIAPPLTITHNELEQAFSLIGKACDIIDKR